MVWIHLSVRVGLLSELGLVGIRVRIGIRTHDQVIRYIGLGLRGGGESLSCGWESLSRPRHYPMLARPPSHVQHHTRQEITIRFR